MFVHIAVDHVEKSRQQSCQIEENRSKEAPQVEQPRLAPHSELTV